MESPVTHGVDLWRAFAEPRSDHSLFTWQGDDFRETKWKELARVATAQAAGLRELGVSRGTPVGCVLTNASAVCSSILGIWLAGGTVVSLPTLARGMRVDEYLAQLRLLCDRVGTDLLLLEREFASQLPREQAGAVGERVIAYEDIPPRAPLEPDPPVGSDIAFVQFSSGSTSEPKGCQITAAAIEAQLEMLADRLSIDEHECGVMWLPLSHDMGLFGGLLLPWWCGFQAVFSTPMRFMRSPRTWFDDCARFGATVTVGPNFALDLAVLAALKRPPPRPFPMGKCVISAERIDRQTLDRTAEVLGPYGLRRSRLVTAYGLAEATLAVTATRPGEEARCLEVDPAALYQGRVEAPGPAPSVELVSAGTPLDGAAVEIDGDGVGEIVVHSKSLGRGYVGDPEKTAEAFTSDGLRTGDLGWIDDGELFVVGRMDDMLSVAGRQVRATDVEVLLWGEPEVRTGCCALVDVHGHGAGRLAIVGELDHDGIDPRVIAEKLREIAASRCDAEVSEVVFVQRGTLPKSPSGKVQRYLCRKLATAGDPSKLLSRITL